MIIKKIIYNRKTSFVREGGRKFKYTSIAISTNKNDKIGIGISKSRDFSRSNEKSIKKSLETMFKFEIKKKTIPYRNILKICKTKLLFIPKKEGGIIAGGNVKKIIKLTGIKNIICKIIGSKNKINVIKSVIKMLKIYEKKRKR